MLIHFFKICINIFCGQFETTTLEVLKSFNKYFVVTCSVGPDFKRGSLELTTQNVDTDFTFEVLKSLDFL